MSPTAIAASTTPAFTLHEAQELARTVYGLTGAAASLPSERDQNFAIATARGAKYILKIAKSDEDPQVLDFQNAALRHLQARGVSLALPSVVPATDGREVAVARAADGRQFLLRLVKWLDGTVFSAVTPHTERLHASLGRAMAEIDHALLDFEHPLMHRHLHWDLRHASEALQHAHLLDARRLHLIEHFRPAWQAVPWDSLRTSVIHCDANENNVIVRSGRVAGLIDFGDMVHSATVCDLAIAVTYCILDHPDPLAAAATITAAYHERFPLTDAEIAALFPLVTARLAISSCYAAKNAIEKQGDAYQLISAGPVGRLLESLATVPFEAAQSRIREACGPAARTLAGRRRLFGGSLSIAYGEPLHIVRGAMQYLFDESGRRYLDAYNNVPHVGHCHPRVVRAAQDQVAVLNTNTRYLSDLANHYAERIGATLPGALKVCFFVNSGSEANELALRLARAHTGQRNLIVLEHAYHGNTNTMIDISPYKHSGPGGAGAPPWVHVATQPDVYRGAHQRNDAAAGMKYAESVVTIVDRLRAERAGIAGFIAESWPSVGGQIELPPGYLARVYDTVRSAGGVCIADEVQTGYGRLGQHFWGFEAYGVVPDIVVLGKPIGNGHPIGVVITTAEIAASFDNGMEFFSTFGGSTLSCAVGLAVLDVVLEEELQAHALKVGRHLLDGLHGLGQRHPLIGDVRGSGLFLGVELVRSRETLVPATQETAAIVNGMRQRGVLLGCDGPHHNVLKIRPPMPFSIGDADVLLEALDGELGQFVAGGQKNVRTASTIR